MEDLKIYNKVYQLERWQGRFYLYYEGLKIGQLINGKKGLEKQYKGTFENWIDKIKNRDNRRIDNIDFQIERLQKERIMLTDRWL